MAQFLRPNANITTTGVVAGSWADIDEVTADDITTWVATDDNVAATFEVGLTDPSTPISGTCTARVRVALADGGAPSGVLGNSITINAYVYQGTTLIATIGSVTQPTTWTTLSNTFDASLVTDWTDVRIRFTCNASGGSPANRRGMSITWAEIETPDAGGGDDSVSPTGISAGTPSVGTPTIEVQVNDSVSPTGVDTGAPSTGSPALAQDHALTPTGVATGAPTTGTPTVQRRWDSTGLWTPSELANTIPLWTDAYDPDSLTLVSGAVSSWASKVGAITASQGTAGSRPAYLASARNGRPGLDFDGVDDVLVLSALTDFISGTGEGRIIAVGYCDTNSAAYRQILSYGDMTIGLWPPSGTLGQARQLGVDPSEYPLADIYGTGVSDTARTWLNTDRIAIARFINKSYYIKVDGNAEVGGSTTQTVSADPLYGYIGAYANSTPTGDWWTGIVQEIIVINGSMTADEVARVEGYLAWKWGLEASLPVGHAYKDAAPTTAVADNSVTPTGVATGAPSTGTPALAQGHVLTGSGVATGAPSTGTPTLAQDHVLTGVTIAASTPTVGTPALAQDHALGGLVGIAAGTPSVGTPSLSQDHQLAGTGIATGAPSTGTTAIGQDHAIAPIAIATGSPSVGAPALAQDHAFAATGVATGAPSVGSATLAAAGDESVTPTGVTTGTPTVGTPGLTQNHAFEPIAVAAGTPSIGIPGLSQSHALSAPAISAGQPTVGTPGLLQQHAATVTGVTAGAPSTGSPTMQQDHALAPVGVTAGTPLVGLMPLEGEVAVLDELLAGMMVNPGTLTRR